VEMFYMTNGFFRIKRSILLIVFSFCLFSGCVKRGSDGNLSVFRGFVKDDVKTWDPASAYDSVSLNDMVPAIYESLYQYAYLADVYQIEPLLAESMPKYSKDKLTLTIPVKKGILFQDDPCFKATQGKGRELKAQDFVYAFKRHALPSIQAQGWWTLDGKVVGINAFHDRLVKASKEEIPKIFDEEVEGLKALDDYTLQIKLVKPYPQLMYVLAMAFTAPVAREAVEAYADPQGNLYDHPIGTGPYLLTRWDRNHTVVLDRNPNYRRDPYPSQGSSEYRRMGLLADAGKPMPFVDRIEVNVVHEDQPRWLNFMKGNKDLLLLPKDNFREAIINQVNLTPELVKKGARLSIDDGVVIQFVTFNMKDKLVGSNKYLRQALSSAIDREKWISIFTNGTARKMVNLIPPGIKDRPKTDKIKYDYNLTHAKELLKRAGYPGGRGLPPLKFDLRGASTTDRQFGDFITEQFGQIGVKVEVIQNTFPAYLEKLKQGNLQVFYGTWQMDYPDAENIYQLLYGPNQAPGPADANYDNPMFNKLFAQMSVLESSPKRAVIIQKMDDLIQEDCPWVMGYYEAEYYFSHPWLMNFKSSQIIQNKFKYYRINKDIKKRYLE
jgi:oligopeptide transport system substrate-binding protein